MGKAKIDDKWRITLPAPVRKGLKPGDEVIVERLKNVIIIRKTDDPLKMFREIELYIGSKKLKTADASEAKHIYRALKN